MDPVLAPQKANAALEAVAAFPWDAYRMELDASRQMATTAEIEVIKVLDADMLAELARCTADQAAVVAELRESQDPAHVLLPDSPTASTYEQ